MIVTAKFSKEEVLSILADTARKAFPGIVLTGAAIDVRSDDSYQTYGSYTVTITEREPNEN